MSLPGYQCQTCWATFTAGSTCDPQKEADLKCPTCGSTNIKKVELPESWVNKVRSGMRFG